MGAAYFIVLDREIAGFDPFVNGKAVARNSDRLAMVTQSLGLRDINEFVSANSGDLMSIAEELGIELPIDPPPETWFAPAEGLTWVSQLQEYLTANPNEFADTDAVLADLAEYSEVLDTAKTNDIRWHFAVDF